MAAAWFTLCGYQVTWPLEPCRYDLAVQRDTYFLRVQVKTTRTRRSGSWVVTLASTSTRDRVYDPDDIDYFFIVDGDLAFYLVPIAAVGGLHVIRLSCYQRFRLDATISQPT